MATRMKAARKHAPRLAGGRKARRRKAKKRPLRADTVHSDMPLWGRPGFLLRRLHQIHYALFFEECAGFDITPVQYGLLTTLSLNRDLDQNSLARELGIDRTNVADVLNRLARRGLLERRRSQHDGRMVLARLTRAGERLTRKMYRPMRRAQRRLLAPLLSQERNALIINSDPPHQRQQSSWPDDLSAQLSSNERKRADLTCPSPVQNASAWVLGCVARKASRAMHRSKIAVRVQ
jgi:DNA-binding MarR family transcriptional regulator